MNCPEIFVIGMVCGIALCFGVMLLIDKLMFAD